MTDEKILKLPQELIKMLEEYAKASDKLTLQYIEARNDTINMLNITMRDAQASKEEARK